jgi:hypothetical protein
VRRKIVQGGSSVCQCRKPVRYGPSTRIERDTRNFPILKADTPSNTVGEKEERGRRNVPDDELAQERSKTSVSLQCMCEGTTDLIKIDHEDSSPSRNKFVKFRSQGT